MCEEITLNDLEFSWFIGRKFSDFVAANLGVVVALLSTFGSVGTTDHSVSSERSSVSSFVCLMMEYIEDLRSVRVIG